MFLGFLSRTKELRIVAGLFLLGDCFDGLIPRRPIPFRPFVTTTLVGPKPLSTFSDPKYESEKVTCFRQNSIVENEKARGSEPAR